jgi:hypothetical protein
MGLTSLHITNAYHPSSGGIRTFYTALLEAANRERRRVCLLVPGPEDGVEEVGQFGTIYFVRAPLAPVFDRRYRLILPLHFVPGVRGLVIRILERECPDLVEISDKYSLPYLAAMLRKRWHPRLPRPVLAGLTCERFDDNMAAFCSSSRPARAFTRWYIRHIYGPPFDVHIANSEYTAGELRSALPDRPHGFIRVAPMGVHAEAFGPEWRSDALREQLLQRAGGTGRSTLLLYAGRISPEKNIELLLDMLRVLTTDRDADYSLVVAGDGPSATACGVWLARRRSAGASGCAATSIGKRSRRSTPAPMFSSIRTRASLLALDHSKRWLRTCPWSCRPPVGCSSMGHPPTRGWPSPLAPRSPRLFARLASAIPHVSPLPARQRIASGGARSRDGTSTCTTTSTPDRRS